MAVTDVTGDSNGESEVVNPQVIYSGTNAKVKGKLSKVQVTMYADVEALELSMANPRRRSAIIETARQRVEYSRAEGAYSTEKYVDGVKSRLIAEDRKQLVMTRNDEGTI